MQNAIFQRSGAEAQSSSTPSNKNSRTSDSGNDCRPDLTAEESSKAGVEKSRVLYFPTAD
jgi:hypothetical protein